MAKRHTVVAGLSDTLKIIKTDSFSGGSTWAMYDSVVQREIPIHPDDVPELIAMLKAFHDCYEKEGECFGNATACTPNPEQVTHLDEDSSR